MAPFRTVIVSTPVALAFSSMTWIVPVCAAFRDTLVTTATCPVRSLALHMLMMSPGTSEAS